MVRRHSTLFTAEDLYQLPDDGLIHELVRGELISEPLADARHGRVCSNVNFVLQSWARRSGAGVFYTCDTGFVLERKPDTVRGPDVAFVSAERLRPDDDGWFHEGPPDLAVGVLSPGNRSTDVEAKVRNYLDAGAGMVWVIDPVAETLAMRTLRDTEDFGVDDVFTAEPLLPGLRVAVRELFELPASGVSGN